MGSFFKSGAQSGTEVPPNPGHAGVPKKHQKIMKKL